MTHEELEQRVQRLTERIAKLEAILADDGR